MLSKKKVNKACLDFGLSTRRSKDLAEFLITQDLEKPKPITKTRLSTRDISEVKSE